LIFFFRFSNKEEISGVIISMEEGMMFEERARGRLVVVEIF